MIMAFKRLCPVLLASYLLNYNFNTEFFEILVILIVTNNPLEQIKKTN